MKTKKATDLKSEGVTAILYSDPKCGKTHMLHTLKGKTLLVDIDGGACVINDCPNVEVIEIKSDLSNFEEILQDLQTDVSKFDNIVIDNISELEKLILIHRSYNTRTKEGEVLGTPSQQAYHYAQFALRRFTRAMRDLKHQGKNIILMAWKQKADVEKSEGVYICQFTPQMSEKVVYEICGIYDIIGYLVKGLDKNKRTKRIIYLSPTDKYLAGDSQYCQANGNVFLFNENPKPQAKLQSKPQAKKEVK